MSSRCPNCGTLVAGVRMGGKTVYWSTMLWSLRPLAIEAVGQCRSPAK